MKSIPADSSPPDPERPAPKPTPRATTTRFLRLTPARDVPPTPPHLMTRPLPAISPRPTTASVAARPPVPASPAQPVAPTPEPAVAPAPTPAPPAAATITPPDAAKNSSAEQPDDRPMRRTTKRMPNVFAAAPSARWSAPAPAGGSTPLRRISPAMLAEPAEPPVEETAPEPPEPTPAPPVAPAPTEARRSGVLPVPRLKLRRRETEPLPNGPSVAPDPVAPASPPGEIPAPATLPAPEPAPPAPPSAMARPESRFIPVRRAVVKDPVASEAYESPYRVAEPEMAEPEMAPPSVPTPPETTWPEEEPAAHVPQVSEEPVAAPEPAPERPAARKSFVATHRLTAPPVPIVPLTQLARTERGSLGLGFWLLLLLLLLALVAVVYWFGLTPRIVARRELDHEQKLSTERIVDYGVAHLATPHVELPLPGTIEASQQASLYARTTGYVKKWFVDIGDQVKAGQLLAVLDTPDVDQQLEQAIALEAQTQANLAIAQSAAQRWDTMAKARAVAQEDADTKDAAYNEAKAACDSAAANVARLTDLENFKEIRAPFQGRITYRNIDVGSLVTAGTGTPNSELFRLAQTDPLRVYVEVPEASAPAIKAGVQANIQVTAYPGRVFHGEVARDAGTLSDSSRTLRTEIRVDNPDGALLPGAFAEVRLQLLDSAPAVLIPASALIVNANGTSVARLEDHYGHDVVHFTPVRVGRDFGTEVEILENVHQGDRLVTNPPADLSDGMAVTSKPEDHPSPPAAAAPAAPAPRA